MTYCAFCQSVIGYGILVWGGYLTAICKTYLLCKNIFKSNNTGNRLCSCSLFADLNLLTIR